jgi:hypothetical protein
MAFDGPFKKKIFQASRMAVTRPPKGLVTGRVPRVGGWLVACHAGPLLGADSFTLSLLIGARQTAVARAKANPGGVSRPGRGGGDARAMDET